MSDLMGYKGSSFMDAGYIYAPYVPICRTPIVGMFFGASREMVEKRAYFLWEAAPEPKMDNKHYWFRAQEDLVSPVALALAVESGLDFVPGTTLYPYYYYTKDGKFVARARIGSDTDPCEPAFRVEAPIVPNEGDEEPYYRAEIFDLNAPLSVEWITEFLQMFASVATLTEPLPDGISIDPNSFNPRKGIMTRYGKKLLAQGGQHYGKVKLGQ